MNRKTVIAAFLLLCPLFLYASRGRVAQADTLSQDSVRVDTLREVIITSDSTSSLDRIIKERMQREAKETPKVKSLGDILNKYVPRLQDQIVHPFAIKDRKRERQVKRTRKVLEHYDEVKTFQELLDEAVARQKAQDEMEQRKKEREKREMEEDY